MGKAVNKVTINLDSKPQNHQQERFNAIPDEFKDMLVGFVEDENGDVFAKAYMPYSKKLFITVKNAHHEVVTYKDTNTQVPTLFVQVVSDEGATYIIKLKTDKKFNEKNNRDEYSYSLKLFLIAMDIHNLNSITVSGMVKAINDKADTKISAVRLPMSYSKEDAEEISTINYDMYLFKAI